MMKTFEVRTTAQPHRIIIKADRLDIKEHRLEFSEETPLPEQKASYFRVIAAFNEWSYFTEILNVNC